MPPRIAHRFDPLTVTDSYLWACSRPGHFQEAVHGRWTGMLLMAELSVGHASFGEPRWVRAYDWETDANLTNMRWMLKWPCRRCNGALVQRPAEHRKQHDLADRIRVARMLSFNGTVG